MPSYQDPAIVGLLGAIGGALISAAVSVFLWRKTRKVVRLDCALDDPRALLAFDSGIGDKLAVRYEGTDATSVYLFPLELENTGTEPIENQRLQVELASGSRILSYSANTEPQLDFGDIHCIRQDGNRLHLKFPLLNACDRVALQIVSINNIDASIQVGLKNKGVSVRVYSRRSAVAGLSEVGMASISAYAVLRAIPLAGSIARALATLEMNRSIDRISNK